MKVVQQSTEAGCLGIKIMSKQEEDGWRQDDF